MNYGNLCEQSDIYEILPYQVTKNILSSIPFKKVTIIKKSLPYFFKSEKTDIYKILPPPGNITSWFLGCSDFYYEC